MDNKLKFSMIKSLDDGQSSYQDDLMFGLVAGHLDDLTLI